MAFKKSNPKLIFFKESLELWSYYFSSHFPYLLLCMEFFDWNKETASKGKTLLVAQHGVMCGPMIEPINWLRMASCDQPNLGFFLGFKLYHNLWRAWKTSKKVVVRKSRLANWIKLHILVRWGEWQCEVRVGFKMFCSNSTTHVANKNTEAICRVKSTLLMWIKTFREKNTTLKQKLGALLLEQKVLFPLQFDQKILHWSSQGW